MMGGKHLILDLNPEGFLVLLLIELIIFSGTAQLVFSKFHNLEKEVPHYLRKLWRELKRELSLL